MAMNAYECFACKKVSLLSDGEKCPSCGSTNGQVISPERVKEGLEQGVFFNIDPKTGKRFQKEAALTQRSKI